MTNKNYTALLVCSMAMSLISCAPIHDERSQPVSEAKSAAPADPCAESHDAPSLRCAKTATAAFDSKGRLWLAWDQTDRVYVNHSDDFGQTFSVPVAVNPVGEPVEATGEARPKIAIAKNGAVYVAWTKRLSKPHTGHIRFSRSLDNGETFSEPININSDTDEIGHRFESLAVNDNNEIFLTWIDKRDKVATEKNGGSYIGAGLYFTVSEDGGQSFRGEKKIADHVCECCRVSVKINREQLPVVFWRHVFEGQIRDHAMSRFSSKYQPGPIRKVGEDHWKIEGCPHHGPALTISPQGNYYATWFTHGDVRKGLFVSTSHDRGKTFSRPEGFGNPAHASHPDILANDSTLYLTWKESDGNKTTTVLEQHSGDGGKSWSQPRPLAETEGNSDHPFLLSYQAQHYLAWQTKQMGFRLIALGD
jgi:hypothetical protein